MHFLKVLPLQATQKYLLSQQVQATKVKAKGYKQTN